METITAHSGIDSATPLMKTVPYILNPKPESLDPDEHVSLQGRGKFSLCGHAG